MPPIPSAKSVIDSVEHAAESLPSPVSVLRGAAGLLHAVPIQDVFDARDRAGFVVVFGDNNSDGTIDVRLIPIRAGADGMMAMPGAQVGPEDVPIHQVIAMGAQAASLLPAPFGTGVGMALGAVAGAAGMLEHLALGSK